MRHVAGSANGGGADRLQGIEHLTGSRYADSLTGDREDNELRGAQGNDKVSGGGGHDEVYGGDGNDSPFLGSGDDVGGGGNGVDTVRFASPIFADLTLGVASGERADVLRTVENLTATPGADVLRGAAGSNVLAGFGGERPAGRQGRDRHLRRTRLGSALALRRYCV